MKKKLMVFLSMMLVITMLAGCGASAPSSSVSGASASGETSGAEEW